MCAVKNMNNKKIGFVIGGIVVLGIVFYGGLAYGKSHATTSTPVAGQFGGAGSFRGARGGAGGAGAAAGGFIAGQIVSKDATSITVSIISGGSKIIFFDSGTKISKTVAGTSGDLTAGTNVMITGATNSDGSVNATSVQIRPDMPTSATTPPASAVVQ